MIEQRRQAYSLAIHPHAGIVERLTLPGDPAGSNLVNRGDLTGFGALCWTPRGADSARMSPSGAPLDMEAVHLDERRTFAPVAESTADRVVCRNAQSGHTLTYFFAEEHFDIWLEGDLPEADQIALDLDVAFMDLRQNEPPEYQYTVQSPYRAEDRSLCYVYLARPRPPGMLVTALTPAAGWRLRYGRNRGAPPQYRLPIHAIHGLQMVARFHSALDAEARPGPVRFGVRVSFPPAIAAARRSIAHGLGIPILSAPTLGGTVGDTLSFYVEGPEVEEAEVRAPDGATSAVALRTAGEGLCSGELRLAAEGFYRVGVRNAAGRGSDLILHAGAPWMETLRRSLVVLDPSAPVNAEKSYWAHAMALARGWFGPDRRQDALLYDALVTIHMQGVAFVPTAPAAPAAPTAITRAMPRSGGHYRQAPWPTAHRFLGKEFSPCHTFEWDRVQDSFALIQLYLIAARTCGENEFFDHAARIAGALAADNIDERGCVYCLSGDGSERHDYTSVIAPLQALVDLTIEMERRADARAARYRQLCGRVADYLVRRGLDFPTEGVPPHVRWVEDGSISCTALSLLYAYWHLERREEWLAAAGRALDYHEAWCMDAPDVRIHGSSFRYWETQWENDGEGRAINAGHPWTLWQAEALYYWALATHDARRLLQSWNGFASNRCKFMPDGGVFACFTPDYLPDRPRSFSLMHSYPVSRDRGIACYLWPRAADTWLRTAAIIDGAAGLPLALNGDLRTCGEGAFELRLHAPFRDRLFLLGDAPRRLRIETASILELFLKDQTAWKVARGATTGKTANTLLVAPEDGLVELEDAASGDSG